MTWTPVTRELPDGPQTVLVFCPHEGLQVCLGYYHGDNGWMFVGPPDYQIEVTYWQDLPPPPKARSPKRKKVEAV